MSNSKKNRSTTYQVVRDLLEGDSFDEGTVADISTRVNRAESGVRNALMRLRDEGFVTSESDGGHAYTWRSSGGSCGRAQPELDGLERRQRDILEYLRDDNPGGTIGFGTIQIAAAVGTSRLDAWDALMTLSQLGLVRTEGKVWYPTLTGDQEEKTPEPEPAPSPFDGLTRRQRNILQYLQNGNRGYAGEIAAAVGGMDRLDAWDALRALSQLGLVRTEGDRWYATLTGDQEEKTPQPEPEPEPEPETAPKPEPILDLANAVKGLRDGDVEAGDIHKVLQGGLQISMIELAKSAVGEGGSVTYSSTPDGGIELWIHGPERSSTSQVIAALTRAGDWG